MVISKYLIDNPLTEKIEDTIIKVDQQIQNINNYVEEHKFEERYDKWTEEQSLYLVQKTDNGLKLLSDYYAGDVLMLGGAALTGGSIYTGLYFINKTYTIPVDMGSATIFIMMYYGALTAACLIPATVGVGITYAGFALDQYGLTYDQNKTGIDYIEM
ncbi:MAG: hypothetical protein ACK4OM_03350 [Alphaproteobacteria bacterium]